jgi:hypothetical protein
MFEEMPEPERINAFVAIAKKYSHRILLPLSKDTFGLEAHLKDNAADFARVPFQSIDAAYYLLNDLETVKRLLDFLPPGLDLGGYREPWSHPLFFAKTGRLQ